MKKTGYITLTAVSVMTLFGCNRNTETQNIYRSREDCIADYSEPQCTQGGGAGGRGGHWYGPAYRRGSNTPLSQRVLTSEPVHRGGFGGFASHFGSGG